MGSVSHVAQDYYLDYKFELIKYPSYCHKPWISRQIHLRGSSSNQLSYGSPAFDFEIPYKN